MGSQDSRWTIALTNLVIVVSAVFGSIARTDTQTDADERFIPATVVGVSISRNALKLYRK